MKRLVLFLPLLAGLVMLSACTSAKVRQQSTGANYLAPVIAPPGAIYANIKAPLNVKFNHTPINATKTGTATVTHIQWPNYPGVSVSFMESGTTLAEACKNGGLSKIYYADYEVFNVLYVYTRFTVHAYGE